MNKNNLILTIAVLAIVISLFAILNVSKNNSESTLDKMKKTGELNICYVVYPPTIMKDARTNELSGTMIDTVEAILNPIEVKAVYHEQSWGTAALGLQSGVCDLVTAAFFNQIPRAYAVAFTEPLYYIGDTALVKTEDKDRFNTIWDADKSSITVAVANGESGHNFAKENFKNAKLNVIDVEGSDMSRLALEVSSGRADIALAGAGNLDAYADSHDDVVIIFEEQPYHLNPVAWAVRQDDVAFMRFIENSLESLDTAGTLDKIENQYEGTENWLEKRETFVKGG